LPTNKLEKQGEPHAYSFREYLNQSAPPIKNESQAKKITFRISGPEAQNDEPEYNNNLFYSSDKQVFNAFEGTLGSLG